MSGGDGEDAPATAPARHLRKRSFSLAGHRTSVALEPAFWAALERIARARAVPLARLVAEADAARAAAEAGPAPAPLASALRVLALRCAEAAAADEGRG